MEKEIIATRDGSHSIAIPAMQVTYHSIHGAIQESRHVFMEAGLLPALAQHSTAPLRILEIGMGTGLNVLLTLIHASESGASIQYFAIEKYPLDYEIAATLNYCNEMKAPEWLHSFLTIHSCEWEKEVRLSANFSFSKYREDVQHLPPQLHAFDLIYFDAFAPSAQPELWTSELFATLLNISNPGALLTTYCSKSMVRKNMQAAGWQVEKIPGPWGKREMLRAAAPQAPAAPPQPSPKGRG